MALIAAIFLASVLGSFHCAGMCGAFLAVAIGDRTAGWQRAATLQAVYHLGRLTSYVALGAAAGAAGRLMNLAGALAGIRPIAAALAGAAMIAFGAITLLRARGWQIKHMGLPQSWLNLMQQGHRVAMDRPPMIRALSIGLLTTLLPCGWLYAFVVTAAGTGTPLRGALAMAAFWAGTLPALIAVGAGIRGVLGSLGRRLPTLTVIALVAAGLFTLTGRAALDPAAVARRVQTAQSGLPTTQTPPCCDIHDPRR